SSRRRHTRFSRDWSSDVCSSDLTWIDARRVVTVRQTELGPAVQWDVTRRRWRENLAEDFDGIVVITGFIASDEQGVQTTLGRNRSEERRVGKEGRTRR